ncbi:MAG: PaaI family thioesterase [Clostridia bacterium]|nr:PaaI family thioesterase [Clostridia bacterium]
MKVLSTQKNSKNCIICGMENELGVKAPFYILDDDSVASVFKFKSQHQSYPERTHGGMISALLDELMGRALWIKEPDTYGVTTTMTITFRKPVPFDTLVKARGYVTFDSPRGFKAKGEIYSMDGALLAQGEARYLKLSPTVAFGPDVHANDEMCYEIPMDITEIDFPEKKMD